MKLELKNKYIKIAQVIEKAGGRMYLVGGAVRDLALNVKPHDFDFCVTGLSVDELKELFPEARMQGKDFPVFIIDGCEFALARKERKIGTKHTDFEVLSDKAITIEDDLSRRDLTINAMAIDVLTSKLVDPFGGLKDVSQRIIRKTTDHFAEDPLRVYRVARFASKLGFTVSEDTIETMHSMKDELINLSSERVLQETRKAMITDHPEVFFNVLKEAGVLDVHFKELYDLIGVEQPVIYHPEGDAYTHTMEVLQRATLMTPNTLFASDEEITRFCALVHDFGKGATPREEWPRHIGHEERGVDLIHDFCARLKYPKVFEKAGKLTSLLHMKLGHFDSLRPGTKVKLLEQIHASKSISYRGMEIVARADSKDEKIEFAKLATELDFINSTPEIRKKCSDDGHTDYEKLKQLIMERRVKFVKEYEKQKLDHDA